MVKVTIYSTERCSFCRAAKEYFDSKGVHYNEIDVGSDMEKAREMIDKSGQTGVPVIEIGKKIIIGFNQDAIDDALRAEK